MITVPKFRGLNSINVFDVQGRTGVAEGHLKFQQDIKHLLETPLGSVVGNLTYGSNLYRYLFLPIRESTGTLIQDEIKTRIEENYPNILIDSVDVIFNDKSVDVAIRYSNDKSNVLEYINLDFESEGDING